MSLLTDEVQATRPATIATVPLRRWSPQFVGLLIGLSDAAVLAVAGLIAFWARFGSWDLKGLYALGFALMIIVSLNVFHWNGLYRPDKIAGFYARYRSIVKSWLVIVLIILAVAVAAKVTTYFSRVWFFSWCLAAFLLHMAAQTAWAYAMHHGRLAARMRDKVLVVGPLDLARQVIEQIGERSSRAVDVAGVVAVAPEGRPAGSVGDLPVLGTVEELAGLARGGAVDRIILALPWSESERIRDCIDRVGSLAIDVELALPPLSSDLPSREPSLAAGLPAIRLLTRPLSGGSRALKMAEDCVLASAMLLVSAPFLALIALLIKIESPGPVFYRQRRSGFETQEFVMFKFRTMRHDPSDAFRQAVPADPRVTRLGHVLRRTSIDELPQLFNVLRGEMSLVGPRPHEVSMNDDYAGQIDEYLGRHKIKPGMTGWAQVNGARGVTRTLADMRRRVAYDLEYVNNWSIWFDLRILARTLVTVARQINAH